MSWAGLKKRNLKSLSILWLVHRHRKYFRKRILSNRSSTISMKIMATKFRTKVRSRSSQRSASTRISVCPLAEGLAREWCTLKLRFTRRRQGMARLAAAKLSMYNSARPFQRVIFRSRVSGYSNSKKTYSIHRGARPKASCLRMNWVNRETIPSLRSAATRMVVEWPRACRRLVRHRWA